MKEWSKCDVQSKLFYGSASCYSEQGKRYFLSLRLRQRFFALLVGVVIAVIGYYKVPVLSQLTRVYVFGYERNTGCGTAVFFLLWELRCTVTL